MLQMVMPMSAPQAVVGRSRRVDRVRIQATVWVRTDAQQIAECSPGRTRMLSAADAYPDCEAEVEVEFAGDFVCEPLPCNMWRARAASQMPAAPRIRIEMRMGARQTPQMPEGIGEAIGATVERQLLIHLCEAWRHATPGRILLEGNGMLWDRCVHLTETTGPLSLPETCKVGIRMPSGEVRRQRVWDREVPDCWCAFPGNERLTLIPESPRVHEAYLHHELWAMASSALWPHGLPLEASESWSLERVRWPFLVRALAAQGLRAKELEQYDPGSGPLEARLVVSIPVTAARAWTRTPLESDGKYFRVMTRVAKALQITMRQRVALRCLPKMSDYGCGARAYPVICYGCSKPIRGSNRNDLLYDAGTPDEASKGRRLPALSVRRVKRRIAKALAAAGHQTEATRYRRYDPARMIEQTRLHPHRYRRLIAREGLLLSALLQFAAATTQVNAQCDDRAARKAYMRRVHKIAATMNRATRFLIDGVRYHELGTMLLIEGTRALNLAMGRPCPMTATLEVICGDKRGLFDLS